MDARVGGIPCTYTDVIRLSRDGGGAEIGSHLCDRLGFDDYLAFPSGRAALVYALEAAGVEPADEVLLPGYTCHSVDRAVRSVASPVYVDVRDDGCFDVADIRAKASEETTAIVPVHTFGKVVDVAGIEDAAREYGMTVVEDACHALGATHESDDIGSIGEFCFFSFRFSKEVTKFKGGLLLGREALDPSEHLEPCDTRWMAGLLGAYLGDRFRGALPSPVYETVQTRLLTPFFTSSSASLGPTTPVELSDRAATFLTWQYRRLSDRVSRRREHARRYCRILDGVSEDEFDESHGYYRFAVRLRESADDVDRHLRTRGIGTSRMYS
jgi:dTDP-4-amino-4,6-dideoxygalactose transaminase